MSLPDIVLLLSYARQQTGRRVFRWLVPGEVIMISDWLFTVELVNPSFRASGALWVAGGLREPQEVRQPLGATNH